MPKTCGKGWEEKGKEGKRVKAFYLRESNCYERKSSAYD
jgi:hypothetical protein